MIKFGRLTKPSKDIEKEIKKTKRLGFDYVKIGIEAPAILFYKKNEFSISKSLKEFKHRPIGHTTWWYELGSPFPSVRNGWIKQAKADIRIANEFGIKLLNFHFLVLSKFLLQNKKSRYDKTITFEVFKSDKDLLKSREYFKKLWQST